MIGYVEGRYTMKSPAMVYVDVNGIGYEVHISLNTYSAIQDKENGRLFTHLQVKEDSHTLYGFFDRGEKEMFLQLIAISGIGAATARMMLSSLRPDEIKAAILNGNTRLIESVKGIGKKTAERVVLELRDKVGKGSAEVVAGMTAPAASVSEEAVSALVALGINKQQADVAVSKILKIQDTGIKLEDLIKQALKSL